jgi:hypothetical protein
MVLLIPRLQPIRSKIVTVEKKINFITANYRLLHRAINITLIQSSYTVNKLRMLLALVTPLIIHDAIKINRHAS